MCCKEKIDRDLSIQLIILKQQTYLFSTTWNCQFWPWLLMFCIIPLSIRHVFLLSLIAFSFVYSDICTIIVYKHLNKRITVYIQGDVVYVYISTLKSHEFKWWRFVLLKPSLYFVLCFAFSVLCSFMHMHYHQEENILRFWNDMLKWKPLFAGWPFIIWNFMLPLSLVLMVSATTWYIINLIL